MSERIPLTEQMAWATEQLATALHSDDAPVNSNAWLCLIEATHQVFLARAIDRLAAAVERLGEE